VLEEFFKRVVENPEVDLAWTEYCYLKDKYEALFKNREKIFNLLSIG